MSPIDEIRKKIEADQFEFSKHAVDKASFVVSVYKKCEKSLATPK